MTLHKYKYWRKLKSSEIRERVMKALEINIDFQDQDLIGVPASNLDPKVFYSDSPVLKDAPFLSTLVKNPNHIGCHTLGQSEPFFKGTQEIEREVIDICATDILNAAPKTCDGYIASGGTEANIQAVWIYRNLFKRDFGASQNEIVILCSSDAHYSMHKAADLLNLDIEFIPVDKNKRSIDRSQLEDTVNRLKGEGKKYIIVIANMMTTMFGSVDDPQLFSTVIENAGLEYRIHVDGAYGGFLHPFMCEKSELTFENKKISSITMDAHKLVQAPYGTGIFIARKGLMKYVYTQGAKYVKGLDATLSGSRSGANAVAVWMILMTYGPHGWYEKNQILLLRTNWLCERLDELGLPYFRNATSNIVSLKANPGLIKLRDQFGLVPDSHGDDPKWLKIVVMEHVTLDKIAAFLSAVKEGSSYIST